MTNDERMTKSEARRRSALAERGNTPSATRFVIRHSSFFRASSFVIRHFPAMLLLIAVAGCRREAAPAPPPTGPIELHDVTRECGVTFVHKDGSSGRRFIIEPMCAGMATFDYDNDGLIDIYFLNGAALPGTKYDVPPKNGLYRNLGNFQFVDVTDESGAGDEGFGLGVTAGDFDNDGDQDLYLNNAGRDVLLRNNGDGTFSDATAEAQIDNGDLVGAGTAFFDMEGDGDLDLYVANYLEFDINEHVERTVNGFPSYPSPRDFNPVPDRLFRNNGDGTFTDVSAESGISAVAGRGMGMICADCDNDGDTDVFVLNDFGANFFFQNDGTGKFEETAVLTGLAYNGLGQENASMGVDCADVNNDGLLDFFMTDYQGEFVVLYRNLGGGRFEDATQETHAGDGSYNHVNWGTGLIDFDNDGDRDIFIANGHTEDNIDLYSSSTGYKVKNQVLMNKGNGTFVDISDTCGDGLSPVCSSRGTAFDDLDNDGDIDGVVLNAREMPTVMRNDSPRSGHWIQLLLTGTRINRDAVGSRVTVVAGDLSQIAEVHSGRSYQSHFGTRLHFGLGKRDRVDRIEIRWLGGGSSVYENLAVDKLYRIIEGNSSPMPSP
jgi:hypothetical protein